MKVVGKKKGDIGYDIDRILQEYVRMAARNVPNDPQLKYYRPGVSASSCIETRDYLDAGTKTRVKTHVLKILREDPGRIMRVISSEGFSPENSAINTYNCALGACTCDPKFSTNYGKVKKIHLFVPPTQKWYAAMWTSQGGGTYDPSKESEVDLPTWIALSQADRRSRTKGTFV